MKKYLVTYYNESGYVVFEEVLSGSYSSVWNEALLQNYNDFLITKYNEN